MLAHMLPTESNPTTQERPVTVADPTYGENQYARHKIMNEWQALDYIEKFGMRITGI
jgi:hypothetical protein